MSKETTTKDLEKAYSLGQQKKCKEAIALYEKDYEHFGKDARWYYRYAYVLMYDNKFAKAIDIVKKGIAVDDSYPYTYLLLSMLYYWQGEKVEAYKTLFKGKERIKSYEPEYEYEFDTLFYDMFTHTPFVDPASWQNSAVGDEFPHYDPKADAHIKRTDIEEVDNEVAQFFALDQSRPFQAFMLYINGPMSDYAKFSLFDQSIACQLALTQSGILSHGGSYFDQNNQIVASESIFYIYTDTDEYMSQFFETIASRPFPKGSAVYIYDVHNKPLSSPHQPIEEEGTLLEEITVGTMDVLQLHITMNQEDGDISSEMVETFIDALFDTLRKRNEEDNIRISYYGAEERSEDPLLYFGTSSYEDLSTIIQQMAPTFSLQKAIHMTQNKGGLAHKQAPLS